MTRSGTPADPKPTPPRAIPYPRWRPLRAQIHNAAQEWEPPGPTVQKRPSKVHPAPHLYQARITENPSRPYLASDSAATPGSTIIPSISPMVAITYGEAAFNFSAETNT
jgi:hypothetical protein